MPAWRILVVDDEPWMTEACAEILSGIRGARVVTETDPSRAMDRIRAESLDLAVMDVRMPGVDGLELLQRAREEDPNLAVLMMTAFASIDSAVESMKLGASDYLEKPFDADRLLSVVERLLDEKGVRDELRLLRRRTEKHHLFDDIIGESPRMQELFDFIDRVAASDVDVLVTGETGTGKELVARSIHRRSRRADRRFVPLDGGAVPPDLVERELFGHERGAFTGADSRSPGLLEYADGGTFMLDEIGELPVTAQAKLLRVLQERRIRRLGGNHEVPVDVRVIAATSRDLEEEMAAGRFREDLYYRIAVAQVEVPPLRDRPEDIPLLCERFVRQFATHLDRPPPRMEEDLLEVLQRYPWPGNVRELQNQVKRLVLMAEGNELRARNLPDSLVLAADHAGPAGTRRRGYAAQREARIEDFEREFLHQLLRACDGEVRRAAREADIPRSTFYRLLQRHDIDPDRYRA